MQITTKQKKEVMEHLRNGSIAGATIFVWNSKCLTTKCDLHDCRIVVEHTIKDFINGKFTLQPKKKATSRPR